MNNIHCICTTPDVFPVYVNNWNNFPKDNKELIWLSDITRDDSFEVGFKFTEQDIRKEFNFNIENILFCSRFLTLNACWPNRAWT